MLVLSFVFFRWGGVAWVATAHEAAKAFGKDSLIASLFFGTRQDGARVYFSKDAWECSGAVLVMTSSYASKI